MAALEPKSDASRLLVGMAGLGLKTDILPDPVDSAVMHLRLQRQRISCLEGRKDDFRLATALIKGLAERHLEFGGMTVDEAVFHQLDRLSARVVELEAQARRGHLRVVK